MALLNGLADRHYSLPAAAAVAAGGGLNDDDDDGDDEKEDIAAAVSEETCFVPKIQTQVERNWHKQPQEMNDQLLWDNDRLRQEQASL